LGGLWGARWRAPLAWTALLAWAMLVGWLASPISARAVTAPKAGVSAPTQTSGGDYKVVELATWVPSVRTPGRVILQPKPVSFRAEYLDGPRPQKADYLQAALKMMQISEVPSVSQAVLLRYGPADGQQLVAYIEAAAAQRLRQDLKPGDKRQFYGFHVYNYAKGPALVITSYGLAE
jgi:hypothetical protein